MLFHCQLTIAEYPTNFLSKNPPMHFSTLPQRMKTTEVIVNLSLPDFVSTVRLILTNIDCVPFSPRNVLTTILTIRLFAFWWYLLDTDSHLTSTCFCSFFSTCFLFLFVSWLLSFICRCLLSFILLPGVCAIIFFCRIVFFKCSLCSWPLLPWFLPCVSWTVDLPYTLWI